MTLRTRSRSPERGRGERVLSGLWRLRLPLSIPGVPHSNAWALRAGDGVVLVDTGAHLDGSEGELERALETVGLGFDDVRLVVCTHAHLDHAGAAPRVVELASCELWVHPDHAHGNLDAHELRAKRLGLLASAGVPESTIETWTHEAGEEKTYFAGPLKPDRDLVAGMTILTDLGEWHVHHTPGHAPSHVCLHLPERRLLISGDHVLGRVALYFDHGWTPDPIGEFLASLDHVEGLDARLALSGHGKPFTDVRGHVSATRRLVLSRVGAVRGALAAGPATPWELAPLLYGELLGPASALWLLTKLQCYLLYLERSGEVKRADGRWEAAT